MKSARRFPGAIVGSPKTVAEKIVELAREFRVGNILSLLQLGSLPAEESRSACTR